jgi:hypothetical protein
MLAGLARDLGPGLTACPLEGRAIRVTVQPDSLGHARRGRRAVPGHRMHRAEAKGRLASAAFQVAGEAFQGPEHAASPLMPRQGTLRTRSTIQDWAFCAQRTAQLA